MKKKIYHQKTSILAPPKILVSCLALLIAIVTTATTPSMATNTPSQEGKVLVYVQKVQNERAISLQLANLMERKTCISILDSKGNTYFKEFCKEDCGYLRKFNLKQIPDGSYRLIIQQKGLKIVQFFTIGGKTDLAMELMQRTETFFPKLEEGSEVVENFQDEK